MRQIKAKYLKSKARKYAAEHGLSFLSRFYRLIKKRYLNTPRPLRNRL